jgi:hypothetical protein
VYETPEINLIPWLRGDGPFFWIRGKPGSGKSTLMKYLHDSGETSTCIKPWDVQTRVICCWFFFYARGSYIQKSFEGLLQSILYRLVKEEPRLANLILPLYMERLAGAEMLPGVVFPKQIVWSFEDLKGAFDMILQQDFFHLRLFLFLDALDEYDGRPQLVADFLKSIASPRKNKSTQVKICFSSRPWSAFVSNFDTYPGFSIQDFTKRDIWTYTESHLATQFAAQADSDNPSDLNSLDSLEMKPMQSIKAQIIELTSAVVEKAQGVFLWVRLVLNEFLKSAVDGATLNELHEFLSRMPEELEEFYGMILQRIPKYYLLESYNMIEILLRSDQEWSLEQFTSALACSSCKTLEECVSHPQMQSEGKLTQSYHRAMKLKIESRCGGMVEILDTEAGPTIVQFMHQTVKEFFHKPDTKQVILGNFGMSARHNGHSILTQYYLSAKPSDERSAEFLSLAMFHARQSESTTGLSQATFLNSIKDDNFNSRIARRPSYGQYRLDTLLALAVTADLRLYVTEELKKRPILSKMQPKMSLLHTVVQHTMLNQEQPTTYPKINPKGSLGPMCGILLKLGVSLHSEYGEVTPFEWLFGQHWRTILAGGNYTNGSQAMFDVTEALLNAGQSPNIDIFIWPLKEGEFTKPLHLSRSRFTAILLQHQASVNALDSFGRTALDLCISRTISMYRTRCWLRGANKSADYLAGNEDHREIHRRADEAFETTMLLIENGGLITSFGADQLQGFLAGLENFYPIPKEFRSIQLMPRDDKGDLRSPNVSSLHSTSRLEKHQARHSTASEIPNQSARPASASSPMPVGLPRRSQLPKQRSGRLGWISKAFRQAHS